jgi:macrolide transport system ATP-binding/permease protein
MSTLATLLRKVALLFRRGQFHEDLNEEMTFHREQMERELCEQGKTPQEARYAAMRQFGNATRIKERSHEVIGFRMETVAQDLRFALRQMKRNPGFAATAIAVLALGIGAATAIFAFVDAALIRPLPYRDPARLMMLYESNTLGPHFHLSYLDYLDYLHRNTVFQSLDAYGPYGFMMRTPQGLQPAHGSRVTAGFFHTLGVEPFLGRDFRPSDDQPAAPRVTIISYAAWQRQFGGRSDVLGQTVVLDGNPTTIIGVLPRGFHFAPAEPADFWATERPDRGCEKERGCHNLLAVARLRPGISPSTALADVQGIGAQLAYEYPNDDHGRSAVMVPLTEVIFGNIRPILLALFAGAVLLLLIASSNVASLLLVRSERRRREMAVRGALGASRMRLVRQVVTEGVVLAVSAGVLGVVLASLAMRLLLSLVPEDVLASMPYLGQVSLNPSVLGFAASVTVAAALIFSLLPALRISFADLRASLAEASRGTSGAFWRGFGSNMVVVELITAVVLLVGAGLVGKSFYRLLHVDFGFVPDGLATLQVAAAPNAYSTPQQQASFFREIAARVAAIPGVGSVAIADTLPLGDGDGSSNFRIVGRAWPSDHNEVLVRDVSAGYFSTLKTRLLRGRYFAGEEDMAHARVGLINRQMEKTYFPGENAVGQRIYIEGSPNSTMEIVGIVDDIQEGQPDAPAKAAMYRPLNQNLQNPSGGFAVALRAAQGEEAVLSTAATAMHRLDPSLAIFDPETMTQRLHDSPTASMHRSSAWLIGGFAGLALVLSMVGLYGVIAYSVSQRTREIGVRMALGAQRSTVQGMILREAGWLTAVGIALGLGGAMGAGSLMGKLLFGVQAWDVWVLAAVSTLLCVSALVASLVPARRAAMVNPIEALRAE